MCSRPCVLMFRRTCNIRDELSCLRRPVSGLHNIRPTQMLPFGADEHCQDTKPNPQNLSGATPIDPMEGVANIPPLDHQRTTKDIIQSLYQNPLIPSNEDQDPHHKPFQRWSFVYESKDLIKRNKDNLGPPRHLKLSKTQEVIKVASYSCFFTQNRWWFQTINLSICYTWHYFL